MPDTTPTYRLTYDILTQLAQQYAVPPQAVEIALNETLSRSGSSAGTVEGETMQGLLFPALDERLGTLLPEQPLREALRRVSEQLAAQALGTAAVSAAPAGALGAASAAPASHDPADSWDDFGEDDFEFDDPDYVAAPVVAHYDLSDDREQLRLITDLGRISGVESVMVCRENGEVVQARSLRDMSKMGSVVAATNLLLRQRALRLMSAHVGGMVVCMRPLGAYAVAIIAEPGVNVGRLLTELGQVQGSV